MARMQIAEPQQQGVCARKVEGGGGGGVVNAGLTSLQLFSAIIYRYDPLYQRSVWVYLAGGNKVMVYAIWMRRIV